MRATLKLASGRQKCLAEKAPALVESEEGVGGTPPRWPEAEDVNGVRSSTGSKFIDYLYDYIMLIHIISKDKRHRMA